MLSSSSFFFLQIPPHPFFNPFLFILLNFLHYFINSLILSIRRKTLNVIMTSFLYSLFLNRVLLCKYFLMMFQYFFWQSLQNPLMMQCFKRRHPFNRIPFKTALQKTDEILSFCVKFSRFGTLAIVLTLNFQYLLKSFSGRLSDFSPRIRH